MVSTIIIAILFVLGLFSFIAARRVKIPAPIMQDRYGDKVLANGDEIGGKKSLKLGAKIVGGVLVVIAFVWLLLSCVYPQSVGEARVVVNADGTIAGENLDAGWGVKAPWQSTVDFDLFAQQATYAGNSQDGEPKYTNGSVDGYEITTSVKGGAQTNFDLSVTYNQDAKNVTELYTDYRSQALFTQNIVNNQILSITRDIPSAYSPVEFRGEKRGEATSLITEALNKALNKYGVTVSVVNLQNIRYTEDVENSIKAVEVAQQKEQEAQANLDATKVSAQAQVVEAQAEADANRLRSESLTPELIEANRVEALKIAADHGSLVVVPDGSSPLIQIPQQAAPQQ